MAAKQKESLINFPEAVNPFSSSKQPDNLKEISNYMEMAQRIDKMLTPEKPEVLVKVNTDEPYRILHLSDIHFGHNRVDYGMVDQLFDEVKNSQNTLVVLYGDLVEGIKTEYTSTNVAQTSLDFDQELRVFREKYLKPLAEKGKIAAMVGMYDGHEGWAKEKTTINAVRILVDGLKSPDGSPIQIVYNGGDIILEHPNNEKLIIKAFHNPGGGGSELNPVGSQRKVSKRIKLDQENSPDIIAGGHFHDRSAISEEIVRRGDTTEEVRRIFIATGTTKGGEAEAPDDFIIKKGNGLSKKGGSATIIIQKEGQLNTIPTFGLGKSNLLLESYRLWNYLENINIGDECRESILAKYPKSEAIFNKDASRTTGKQENHKINSPLYEEFKWKIDSNLPVIVYTFGNTRYGSSSLNRDKLLEVIKEIDKNPYAYGLALRHMVDSMVSKSPDRMHVLRKMTHDLQPIAEKNKLLGLMLSGSLREDSWMKRVKSESGYVEPVVTGDYLYYNSFIKGTPLYKNNARAEISVADASYAWLLLDHLSHSGSAFDPFRGLRQAENQAMLAYDGIIGGHMPNAGILQIEKTDYVAPGWFSSFDSQGKANEQTPPLGGQALILFPEKKLQYSGTTFAEAKNMYEALFLHEGLNKIGKLKPMLKEVKRRN